MLGDLLSRERLLPLAARLVRTKDPTTSDIIQSKSNQLKRCLTTLDLTSLGVGSCVGTGMYLVAGMVARKIAGPGVIFSFIIAAVASLFSGVCYAEFGVRVPHTTGSAYMYSYVTVGEFVAFVIGWNMVLEYLIGSAAGACAISACLNAMADGAIGRHLKATFGTFIGHTPDFLAAFITVLMTALMVAGVKKSLLFNNILNCLNFVVWVFIMIAGLFYIDFNNWSQHGGFLPYGWSGVLAGAATCFYAFIGFDIIATTGEEAQDPKTAIPTAIIWSLLTVLTAYITSSMMVTLIVPYTEINANSGLVEMFAQRGSPTCQYIVALGALAGLVVSMFGSMFPMPRVVYAMAKDGLIFRSLARVWPISETPAFATIVLGALTAVVATIMSLDVLVEMMSIGTLMAYTLVSTCVLLLRYQPGHKNLVELLPESVRSACPTPSAEYAPSSFPPVGGVKTHAPPTNFGLSANTTVLHAKRTNRVLSPESDEEDFTSGRFPGVTAQWRKQEQYGSMNEESVEEEDMFQQPTWWDLKRKQIGYMFPWLMQNPGPATDATGMHVMKLVGLLYVLGIAFNLTVVWGQGAMQRGSTLLPIFSVTCLFAILVTVFLIAKQPQAKCDLKFKAPGVPIVPAVAIVVNIYLIFKLSYLTLIRFVIWMTLGFFMYFCYGIRQSSLECSLEERIELKIPPPEKPPPPSTGGVANPSFSLGAPPSLPTNPFLNIAPIANKIAEYTTGNGSVSRDVPAHREGWQTFD